MKRQYRKLESLRGYQRLREWMCFPEFNKATLVSGGVERLLYEDKVQLSQKFKKGSSIIFGQLILYLEVKIMAMNTYEVRIVLKGGKKVIDTIKARDISTAKKVMQDRYPDAHINQPKKID